MDKATFLAILAIGICSIFCTSIIYHNIYGLVVASAMSLLWMSMAEGDW